MSKNVDLTSKEWCDLVFEGKNKAFGGYLLRVNSPKRYTWATIGVICVVAFAFVLPYIVESFKFGEVEEETTVVVEMTQLPEAEVEKQEVQPLVETPPPPPLKSSIKFTAPVIKKDEEVSDEEELKANWGEVVNNVADIIQKKLEEVIEIFNVYIIFFQEEVDTATVDLIEQNKYSSRKLVINEKMPEDKDELEKIISEKLFELYIEKDNDEEFIISGLEFLNTCNREECESKLEQYIEKQI